MNKTIELKMDPKKDINIYVNNKKKHVIKHTDRTITAEELYNLLDFAKGDVFNIKKENKSNLDKAVLDSFCELFQDIAEKANDLSKP